MSERILLSPAELAAGMTTEPMVIIDTRDPDAYAAGHLPGAVNMRDIFTYLATSTPEGRKELEKRFADEFGAAGLSGKETAVLYEESMNSGFGQSCRGYFLLTYLGYPKVKVLHGGYAAWVDAGMPVSMESPKPTPAPFPLKAGAEAVMVDKQQMLAALDNPSIVILDVRDVDEWVGTSSSPYGKDYCPRKGRIPGARWIEWYRMMKPTPHGQMFKEPEEILAECATAGITPESTVYLYCFKGARASNTYLALQQAGITDVKVYFGSWNEWSRDFSLPIESGMPELAAAA
ncbi:MAG: sulfurtransferase [Thiomonas sp. 13-66-29]|jgi:thiosulfate/3-mercaptopyruvate sulfurtransferase|nr:MAG: sulfurtransferase [Thiomonas sp. 13-66-29]